MRAPHLRFFTCAFLACSRLACGFGGVLSMRRRMSSSDSRGSSRFDSFGDLAMPETPEEIQKRLAAENAKMREAIFEAGQAWASLENHMALVLTAVLNIVREQHSNASLAIYFAPSNSETRFAIVDAAFTCLSFPPVETHDRVMACWARFMSKAHSARGVRNKIVHGEVQNLPSPTSGRPQVRLTGQIFDLKRNEFVAAYASKQLPGMSRNDVKQNADKLWTLIKCCGEFEALIAAQRAHDPTLPEILARLEVRLPIADTQKADPNSSIPQPQPKPSGE